MSTTPAADSILARGDQDGSFQLWSSVLPNFYSTSLVWNARVSFTNLTMLQHDSQVIEGPNIGDTRA